MRYLNLGCGNKFSDDWENVDFFSKSQKVKSHNLLQGIPYPSEFFDVVYHSHLLEHFSKSNGIRFMQECFRVLKPRGVIRVVVPDLEQITSEYLKNLVAAKSGAKKAEANYRWIILEMYDQVSRNFQGGEVLNYWDNISVADEKYVGDRVGEEFYSFRRERLKPKVKQKISYGYWKDKFLTWNNIKTKFQDFFLNALGVEEYVKVGKFRLGGEVHQWMYDEYSLGELLKNAGFVNVKRISGFESSIPEWAKYKFLDVEGTVIRKPDSLFMEAFK